MDGNIKAPTEIKAMNGTMGPNGLIASLIVFGTMLNCPAPFQSIRNQTERLQTPQIARSEMETINAVN